jgi:hypothetical protein
MLIGFHTSTKYISPFSLVSSMDAGNLSNLVIPKRPTPSPGYHIAPSVTQLSALSHYAFKHKTGLCQ